MWLKPASTAPGAVLAIAKDMRAWDRHEIFATRADDDIEAFAQAVPYYGPAAWVAGTHEEPIACFGCAEMWPGVWSMWFFATDKIDIIGLSVTRLIVRAIVPSLWQAGAHRLECRSMQGHHEAQRWLTVLGATREATLKGFGRAGEDFHVYTWARPDVL